MNFKLVDKKNMGGVALLLLVIILSQSRFFNFLIDTALGRAFLIQIRKLKSKLIYLNRLHINFFFVFMQQLSLVLKLSVLLT